MENSNIKFINYTNDCVIDKTVKIGKNVTIYPGNVLLGNTVICDNVVLYPNNLIKDSTIMDNVEITSSVIEQSVVHSGVKIGPFAHLRPESEIMENVRIGNFVEIKKSKVGAGTKVSHLTYVGNAEVGKNCNIGCGVVFINYNGRTKSKTVVEDNCFIGSSVNLIAPTIVKHHSYVCAGTTIDKPVESGSFVIGRSKMIVKPGRAKNYLKQE